MKIAPIEKSDWLFIEIRRLTNESFQGVEVPPVQVLRREFEVDDIFVRMNTEGEPALRAYLILSEKYGEPYIWSLATDKPYRGQGLAASLLTEVDEFVKTLPTAKRRGITGVGLTTHVNNPAQKLYFDHGYRVKQVLDNYYLGGDGLYMRKEVLC
jgi:ribosomal protein S18 acetylase RimI-like enzyme